jgi:autotransporter-associated beta strand protein
LKKGGGTVGLIFGGTASPTITLDSVASGTAGRILLNQDLTVDNTLTSGTAQILNGGSEVNSGFIDLQNGTRTFTVNDGDADVDLLISAVITNGAVTKAGTGTFTITSAVTYIGNTEISAGTLLINGSTSTSSVVNVAALATIGGIGTVGGNTTISGNHAPGTPGVTNGIGTQNFSGDLTYDTESVFKWGIYHDTMTTTTTYDKVVGTNTKTLGGSGAVFDISGNLAYTDAFWDSSYTWTDIFSGFDEEDSTDWDSIFTSIAGTNLTWNAETSRAVFGNVDPGGDGGYFTITGNSLNWTAIPEPTSALAGLLIGAGLLRRRRRSA